MMRQTNSLTGRLVSHCDLPDDPTMADSWWGDPPWSRFMVRTHGDDLMYLVVSDAAGKLCATAPLLLSTAERGPFFVKLPAIVGDEHAFGDESQLTPDERAAYDVLREKLALIRAGQFPAVAISTRGANHGIAVATDSPVTRAAVLEALPDLLAGAASELGCRSHGILHLAAGDDGEVRQAGEAHGYHRVVLGAESALEIPAVSNWEEYLTSLRSHPRIRHRKEMRRYLAQGMRTVVRTGPDAITEDIIVLQARIRAKYGMAGDTETVRREFDDIRETVGDSCVVFTAERAGRTVGFALCLHDRARHELHGRSAGFDYDEGATGCYFALAYNEVPAWAIEHGVRRIWYGLSTYETKRSRGCRLLPLYGYLRFDGSDGDLLHQAARLQSVGERRRLAALDADVTD